MAVPQRHQGRLCCAQPPVTTSEQGNTISNPPKCQYLAFLNQAGSLLQILDCCAHEKDDRTGGQGKGIFSTSVTSLGGVKLPAKDLLITLLILQAQAGHCHLRGHRSSCQCFQQLLGAQRARLGSVGQGDAVLWSIKGTNWPG